MRILHCPSPAGGLGAALAAAERELGLDSRSVVFTPPLPGFPADEVLFQPELGRLGRELRRWGLLRRALSWADVVHLSFGSSIMPQRWPRAAWRGGIPALWRGYQLYAAIFEQRDLAWLRRAGKGIVVTYQGDDARQADVLRSRPGWSPVDEVEPAYYPPGSDEQKRRRIRRVARYAHRIYAVSPDLLALLPDHAELMPIPTVDPREWRPRERAANEVPVLAHAPSHRGVKGTRFVLDAVRRLQAEGVPLEFVLIEGADRYEARRALERADLVVDQLLLGWYGSVAVEAMALGTPVVAHIREEDLSLFPLEQQTELPVVAATPETVHAVLKELVTSRRSELPELGRRGRTYVERWHDPLVIAARLKREYEQITAD